MFTTSTEKLTSCSIDGGTLVTFATSAAKVPVRPIKITFRGRQGWSKDIGQYRKTSDGKAISRRFWLGHDQARAVWMASTLFNYYEQFVKHGSYFQKLWTSATGLSGDSFSVDKHDAGT